MDSRIERIIQGAALALVIGPILTVAAFGQQGKVKPVGRVVVVDSNGKIVGATLGGTSIIAPGNPEIRATVLLDIDQHLVAVNVARDRLYAGVILLFDSEGCTGNAWYVTDSSGLPPLLPRAVIGPPGRTVYVERQDAPVQTVMTKSRFINGNECVNFTFSLPVVPAQPLVDLLTVFTPPFSLRAAP